MEIPPMVTTVNNFKVKRWKSMTVSYNLVTNKSIIIGTARDYDLKEMGADVILGWNLSFSKSLHIMVSSFKHLTVSATATVTSSWTKPQGGGGENAITIMLTNI